MQLEDRSACVSDLAFDEWFAGEGTPAQWARLEAHLHACTRCCMRGELLERERAAFLAKAPTFAANAQWARRRPPGVGSWHGFGKRSRLALAVAALSSAIALLAFAPRRPWMAGAADPSAGSAERRKGSAQVGFYIKRGEHVQRGASGDTVYPGDQLRFTYSSESPAYLAVLGRDASAASVYFPSGSEAARIPGGREQALDFSLELDAQLGEEQLFVVLCPTGYALAPLRAGLEASNEVRAPPHCRVEHIALHKQARP